MSLVTWKISQNGGVDKDLATWGIETANLVLRNQDVDELTVSAPVQDIAATPIWAYGDTITLKRVQDGVSVTWFVGKVRKTPIMGTAKTEGNTFVVSGAWWDLLNLVYQQPRTIFTSLTTFQTYFTTRVILGQNDSGVPINIGAQITAILAYATAQGSNIAAGSISTTLSIPYQEAKSISCAEAIRRMMSYIPDAVAYFDYSTGVPVMNIKQRASLTPVTLSLIAASIIEKIDLQPRQDLVPTGVTFNYMNSGLFLTDGKQYSQITQDVAGAASGIGVLFADIDLMGTGTQIQELAPSGLAAAYYASLSTLNYDGSITLHEVECTGALTLGNVLNVSNGRAAWATMKALLQIVKYDLKTGETECDIGFPDHLSPQSFINQLAFTKKGITPTSFFQTKTTGVDPSSNDFTNHGASGGLGAIECETQSGAYALCGYDEYVPSIPPRKYLSVTPTGTLQFCYYTSLSCVTKSNSGFQLAYNGVACTYNPTTCTAGTGGQVTTTGASGGNCSYGGGTSTATACGVTGDDASLTTTLTATTRTVTGNGLCVDSGDHSHARIASGSAVSTLSSEDTETAAITRASSGLTWSASVSCDSAPAFAVTRGAGVFSAAFQNVRVRAQLVGLVVGQAYTANITILQRAHGSSDPWIASSIIAVGFVAAAGVALTAWQDVPKVAGMDTKADGVALA